MKINKYIYSILTLSLVASCQTLEETYSEYSGDGLVRNVGKVTNLMIDPAWHKLNVSWDNSIDPNIENIVIEWVYTDDTGIVNGADTLASTVSDYTIENLDMNANVEIRIFAMDGNKNKSLGVATYNRPYTLDHEDVIAISQVISASYMRESGKVILFYHGWSDKISTASLHYTNSSGTPVELELTKAIVDGNTSQLSDIDITKPITVKRMGFVGVSNEVVKLDDIILETKPDFTPSFKTLIFEQYNIIDITTAFCAGIEELNININIITLRDLLNFPNLNTVNIGNKKYMVHFEYGVNDYLEVSNVNESKLVLKMLKDLNNNITINRYLEHFNNLKSEDGITNIAGYPALPSVLFKQLELSRMKCNKEDDQYNPVFPFLVDNNNETPFMSYSNDNPNTYEFTFDVTDDKKPIEINGFDAVQFKHGFHDIDRVPSFILVEYSDGNEWENVSHIDRFNLGRSTQETSRLELLKPIYATKIRVSITCLEYGGLGGKLAYEVVLAEFRMF